MPDARSEVGRYYDKNTRRFLTLGHGGGEKAIRRAVWGPSTADRSDAIEYVNSLVLSELRKSDAGSVLDLGCGVGGSIHYLSRHHPASYLGATISSTQARMGSDYLRDAEVPNASIVQADFTDPGFCKELPGPMDVAFAVESFIHVEHIADSLQLIGELIRPGGKLIVCDDMIAVGMADRPASSRPATARHSRWLREFRTGWHAAGLTSIRDICAGAARAGFRLEELRDLTGYLELDRTRDLAARALMAALRWSPFRPPWFANLLGGNALQLCLKNGIIRYVYAVFTRSEDTRK